MSNVVLIVNRELVSYARTLTDYLIEQYGEAGE